MTVNNCSQIVGELIITNYLIYIKFKSGIIIIHGFLTKYSPLFFSEPTKWHKHQDEQGAAQNKSNGPANNRQCQSKVSKISNFNRQSFYLSPWCGNRENAEQTNKITESREWFRKTLAKSLPFTVYSATSWREGL